MTGPEVEDTDRLQRSLQTQVLLGVLLTAVAGFVDTIGYIGLGGLFVSFMSGASVSLGVGLKDGHWDAVGQGLFMIASFLGGVTLGTVLRGTVGPWALSSVLLIEAIFLAGAALMAGSGWAVPASILPVAAAMGVQNTALQPVSGVRLGVTFITGTLVSLGQAFGQALLGQSEAWRRRGHSVLWGALVVGATVGTSLNGAFGPRVLIVPAILVIFLALLSAVSVLATRLPDPAYAYRDPEPVHPSVWPYY
ncbi:YoaK family protein [Microvirga sp. Mcv34]|uniref:YoaK family protein n=1 Tax=Microvirga sp. Mcv34 TaxID=2926016 RepID=UPI0021C6ED8E|nr:YoaK family protein [Microvirga sp. Mcv34]